MTTITEFLLARIAEDEAVAREADGRAWWIADGDEWGSNVHDEATGKVVADQISDRHAAHIVRHDPARVLAECEAKRRVIEYSWGDRLSIEGEWGSGRSREEMDAKDDVPDVVRALAAIYAEHPDYREEWRA